MSTLRRAPSQLVSIAIGLLLCSLSARAIPWFPLGPDGGDARSLAVDPLDHRHVYLGTLTGWIYESHTGGREWKRLARVGNRDDLVLDNIVVDRRNSKHILVGAFVVDRPEGGLFTSEDAGLTWTMVMSMQAQSIRSLAQSASSPRVWVAGTLTGVQRSDDDGAHWKQISPEGSTELHEVESVAIDPKDPSTIYAGTWHLPWKTTDGGGTWQNIKEGIIDDSDVFSIIVDPEHSAVVYASACSGIYKSENGGGRFQKVEGIPSEARRTRVLMQDPGNRDVVFAGTTEGLFRTGDAGKIWIRMTGGDVIVNDIYIDPTDSNRMLIATDRSGVLASNDGGSSFQSANKGFSARHLSSFAADVNHPATVYVGVLNDKQWGGVFRSETGALSWTQQSDGLNGSDVFSLVQAPDGTMLAGTGHGIYRLKDQNWEIAAATTSLPVAARGKPSHQGPSRSLHPQAGKGKVAPLRTPAPAKAPSASKSIDAAVYALAVSGDAVFAATSEGLIKGGRAGEAWGPVADLDASVFYFAASAASEILVAGLKTMVLSRDGGVTWKPRMPPPEVSLLTAVAVDGDAGLWAAGREGVFLSVDDGASWRTLPDLYVTDANSLAYDARGRRMLITTGRGTYAYAVQIPQKKVTFWDTGWNLRLLRPVGDYLVGVTPFDGVVIQPRMVDSPETPRP